MADLLGSVMVVGGGVAGIQASLDLAEMGFKVYIVEDKPVIGGNMARLDKTFPTNDCAMCILSPKLVAAGRHPNIELVTGASVTGSSGAAGNFTVRIRKRSKYVDEEKCIGCALCVEKCPVKLPNEFDKGLVKRKAIYIPFPQAVPMIFSIDKQGIAPCTNACPGNLSAQGYVNLIREGMFKEAIQLIRDTVPLPSVCGRICHHPCEEACNRKEVDQPVAIAALKAFIGDHMRGSEEDSPPEIAEKRDEKVAIVGAGPAGLAAAYKLALKGFGVKIFEASESPGGMLMWGIPDYRLSHEVLQADIDYILKTGIEIEYGKTIGKDISLGQLRKDFNAVFLAIGAQLGKKLPIAGADLEGSIIGLSLLRNAKLGKKVKLGKRVLVLGGGNAAFDCARTALRMGAEEVHMACLESREEMPAYASEIEESEEEGIVIHPSLAFTKIIDENGKVKGVECQKVKWMKFDEDGRLELETEPESEHVLPADTVIFAIGQSTDLDLLSDTKGIETTKRRTIAVDTDTMSTGVKGLFAGGDAVSGPASAIEAIAAGNCAAEYIEKYIDGESVQAVNAESELKIIGIDDVRERVQEDIPLMERATPERLSMVKRKTTFEEVEKRFNKEQAVKEAERCLDCGPCALCLQCMKACDANAIDYQMKEQIFDLNVGSIILSPGFDEFDPALKPEYGYGIAKNVVSSMEFERILSTTGPSFGRVERPSDGKVPKKIAFIQCVGSRDEKSGCEYCSSVCCMYSIKEAVIAKEHTSELEPTIFYMDMRTFGKHFDEYYNSAKNDHGVRFVRSRVASVSEDPLTQNLNIKFVENNEPKEEEFDLVILAAGFRPPKNAKELSAALKFELNKDGFASTGMFNPVDTTNPGIFVSGAFSAPKDIPMTVTEASAAAARAGTVLAGARGTMVTPMEYPPEIDVSDQEPRIGVFICQCGINIGGVVDVPAVTEYAGTLPGVVYVENNLYTCSQDTQEKIKEIIKEHKLNRIVVASCTPRTHEPLFQNTIREAGLNPYLFEMANIRDQCSWIHMHEPKAATKKSKDLLRMAVAKAELLEPLKKPTITVNQAALVIGGGVAGMTAALELAKQGFQVHLVEKGKRLGGYLEKIHFVAEENAAPQKILKKLVSNVESNNNIKVYKGTTPESIEGYIGNFKTRLGTGEEFEHGIVIVATGAQEHKPQEYLYGQDQKVKTLLEFEEMLSKGEVKGDNFVFIQCVGSREGDNPNCSRVCCTSTMTNAIKIKERNPNAKITVLYRDIRTYGFREKWYKKAADMGVLFIRFDDEEKPMVEKANGKLKVSIKESETEDGFVLNTDYLILASGTRANPDNKTIAPMLKVPVTKEGFFLEAHMKLRPIDFATEGVFLAGTAHGPKFVEESIAQALGAASRAVTILSKDSLEAEGITAQVDTELCEGCGDCEEICEFGAARVTEIEPGVFKSQINEVLCKGCGACVGVCPESALNQKGFTEDQLVAMIIASLKEKEEVK